MMLIIAPTRELAMQSQEVLEEASNIVKIRRNTQLSKNLKIVLMITKFEFLCNSVYNYFLKGREKNIFWVEKLFLH